MREILFRGKEITTAKWVYGGYYGDSKRAWIRSVVATKYGREILQYEVDPSTVGQYTGLKDKLGKDIFEGDILFDSEWECEGHVAWANEHLSWMIVMSGEKEFLQEFITDGEAMCAGCTHIIGNIHDNPEELLEVSQ